jgi:hypothetical protein
MAPREWYKERHENASKYRPHRPESSFKGTVNCTLFQYFKPKDNWMIVPEISLRDVAENKDKEPAQPEPYESDTDDEFVVGLPETEPIINEDEGEDEDTDDPGAGDISYVSRDSQGGVVEGDRRSALRPDFGVAKAQSELFSDRNHLYVEVKNGEYSYLTHTIQISEYIEAIARAIPTNFSDDVVLMLIDAQKTFIWRITPQTSCNQAQVWRSAKGVKTHGPYMHKVLTELSGRP